MRAWITPTTLVAVIFVAGLANLAAQTPCVSTGSGFPYVSTNPNYVCEAQQTFVYINVAQGYADPAAANPRQFQLQLVPPLTSWAEQTPKVLKCHLTARRPFGVWPWMWSTTVFGPIPSWFKWPKLWTSDCRMIRWSVTSMGLRFNPRRKRRPWRALLGAGNLLCCC